MYQKVSEGERVVPHKDEVEIIEDVISVPLCCCCFSQRTYQKHKNCIWRCSFITIILLISACLGFVFFFGQSSYYQTDQRINWSKTYHGGNFTKTLEQIKTDQNEIQISVFILDVSGNPINKVAIFEHDQLLSFTIDEFGEYHIAINKGVHTVSLYHPDYAPYTLNVTTFTDKTRLINITLLEVKNHEFSINEGLIYTDDQTGTKFKIPVNIFVDIDGRSVHGQAILKFGFLDSKNSDHWQSMPGGYQGYLADGTFGIFESYNALYLDFVDSIGNPLYIKQSIEARQDYLYYSRINSETNCNQEIYKDEENLVKSHNDYIEISFRVTEDLITSLQQNETYFWRFDQKYTTWIVSNQFHIEQKYIVDGYYTSKIRQTGWYNIDKFQTNSQKVRIQIVEKGVPLKDTQVQIISQNQAYIHTAWTNADGYFIIWVNSEEWSKFKFYIHYQASGMIIEHYEIFTFSSFVVQQQLDIDIILNRKAMKYYQQLDCRKNWIAAYNNTSDQRPNIVICEDIYTFASFNSLKTVDVQVEIKKIKQEEERQRKETEKISKKVQENKGQIGTLNFALEWSDPNDLDLHVTDPVSKDVINFQKKKCEQCGAELDVDMNYAKLDAFNPVEHIYFTKVAIGKQYKIMVRYYSQKSMNVNGRLINGGDSSTFTVRVFTDTGKMAASYSGFVNSSRDREKIFYFIP